MKNWEEVNGSPFRFWLLAVTAMLIFYTPEARSPWFVFAFACACELASIYGFVQGAWPFGLVGVVWMLVASHRWRYTKNS